MKDEMDGKGKNNLFFDSSFAAASADEIAKLRSPSSSSKSFIENVLGTAHQAAGARIFFLRDFSTPSILIEQSLKRAGHHVVAFQHPEDLAAECGDGDLDLVVMDYGLPLVDRLTAVRRIREAHLTVPIVLIFTADAEQEVTLAMTEAVNECVIRDRDGAYLFKIQDVVNRLVLPKESVRPHRVTPRISNDEITEQIDLKDIAEKVSGAVIHSQKASFVVMVGPDTGSTTQLDRPLLLIGRDASCDLQLKDESVSRFHATVKQHPSGVVTIRDMKSSNGTFVDGRRVQIEELKEGSKILLGKNTVIRYQTQDTLDKTYYDELYYASTRDELTGVYNRRFCLDTIETNLSFARRHGLPVSILMFDVDFFKHVNDTFGHLTGDSVLASIAAVIKNTVRQEDVIGRYGGEEFIVFALNTNIKGACVLAERIRRSVEALEIAAVDGTFRIVRTTISIGVATSEASGHYDLRRLISAADEKLYEAKRSGRNCCRS